MKKWLMIIILIGILIFSIDSKIRAASFEFIPTANYTLLDPIPREYFINNVDNDYPSTAVKIGHSLAYKSNAAFKISFYAGNTKFKTDYQNKKSIASPFYSLDSFDFLKETKDVKKITDRMFYLQSTEDYEFVLMDSSVVIDLDGGSVALEINEKNPGYFDLNLFIGDLYDYPDYLKNLVVHIPNPVLQNNQLFIQELLGDKIPPEILSPLEEAILQTDETFDFNDFIEQLVVQDSGKILQVRPYLYSTNYDEITRKIPGEYYAIYKARDYSYNETTFRLKIKVVPTSAEIQAEKIKTFLINLKDKLFALFQFIKTKTERFFSILKRIIS